MSTVKGLKKNYGSFSLDIAELPVHDKGITVLWGPSGAGKTSIFRILTGLEPNQSWSWELNGCLLHQLAPPARRIGVVFQNFDLFNHLSARQNILFAASARKLSKDETELRFRQFVQSLNLERILDQPASQLSGGECQRVALARALIGKPQILFLDEPFSALDEDNRSDARQLIKKVIQAEGIPAVIISHDRYDLDELADQVVKIKDGRLA